MVQMIIAPLQFFSTLVVGIAKMGDLKWLVVCRVKNDGGLQCSFLSFFRSCFSKCFKTRNTSISLKEMALLNARKHRISLEEFINIWSSKVFLKIMNNEIFTNCNFPQFSWNRIGFFGKQGKSIIKLLDTLSCFKNGYLHYVWLHRWKSFVLVSA
jgi:hypothetical protein